MITERDDFALSVHLIASLLCNSLAVVPVPLQRVQLVSAQVVQTLEVRRRA